MLNVANTCLSSRARWYIAAHIFGFTSNTCYMQVMRELHLFLYAEYCDMRTSLDINRSSTLARVVIFRHGFNASTLLFMPCINVSLSTFRVNSRRRAVSSFLGSRKLVSSFARKILHTRDNRFNYANYKIVVDASEFRLDRIEGLQNKLHDRKA